MGLKEPFKNLKVLGNVGDVGPFGEVDLETLSEQKFEKCHLVCQRIFEESKVSLQFCSPIIAAWKAFF